MASRTPKTLALFFDGTWNGPEHIEQKSFRSQLIAAIRDLTRSSATAAPAPPSLSPVTNVLRMMRRVLPSRPGAAPVPGAGDPQVCLYFSGVGTDPSPVFQLIEGAFGYGIDRDIQQAYQFIAQNFEDGDNLYLFGFSRGAFTARSLAGFIDVFGMIPPGMMHQLPRVYVEYMKLVGQGERDRAWAFARDELRAEHKPIPIWFLGVWDTVGALWRGNPDHAKAHQIQLPTNVTRAYQALALHEVRQAFEPVLWTEIAPGQIVEQVWFSGSHSDVGGGQMDRRLSDVALRWMACKAMQAGLGLDVHGLLTFTRPEPDGDIHDAHQDKSLWGDPEVRRMLPHEFSIGSHSFWRTIGIHASAVARAPKNLPTEYGDVYNPHASTHRLLLIKLIEADQKRYELEKAVTKGGLGVVRDDCDWV